jgi:hypothetical protein
VDRSMPVHCGHLMSRPGAAVDFKHVVEIDWW